MEKERIDLFGGERKRLTEGTYAGAAARIRRGGVAFFSTMALGISLFAIVFIVCCFCGEFRRTAGNDISADTVSAPGTVASGTPGDATDTSAAASANDTEKESGGGLLALLKSLLEAGKKDGNSANAEHTVNGTISPAEQSTPPEYAGTDELYRFDYALVPQGEIAIVPMDMSLSSYGETYIYNDTSYSPKISALLESDETIPAFDYLNAAVYPVGDPVVLIVHTHGTEAYSAEGSISYAEGGELARSCDITENVVAVGAVLAEELNARGVKTLHCTVMHDKESYRDSYNRSAATINEYLANYPSIQYVIDVHRDSLNTASGALIRPVTVAGKNAAAQVMCVVGSDYNGAEHPSWQKNLSLALKLRTALNEKYSGLCRPVYLRGSAYNQQYAPLSLLLEIGASGNSLSEAKEAARLCGGVLADIIKRKAE